MIICFLIAACKLFGQNEKPALMVSLSHFTENNNVQYLKVQTRLKANNKLQPLNDVSVQLYLDSIGVDYSIGGAKTDEQGSAQIIVPANLKNVWATSPDHKFIALVKASKIYEETTTELDIAKAKIEIDTLNADGTKSVTARVFSLSNGEWVPTKGVEIKIGVERLGGSLKIGDDETYTTDSLGKVTCEFKLDSLPADDAKGNINLIAKVEDNDQFGNLSIRKTVPWGKYYQHVSTFGRRSLSAARFKAPLWLLFMAYSIVASVWTVIIYLIIQVFKMKKLSGDSNQSAEKKIPTSELII